MNTKHKCEIIELWKSNLANLVMRLSAGAVLLAALAGQAQPSSTVSDDFEDGVLNSTLWAWGGSQRGFGSGTSGPWYWSHTETNGRLRLRVWGPEMGNTYGAEAWVGTLFNYNNGQSHLINFTWGASVNAYHIDAFAIQIANGSIPTGTDIFWHFDDSPTNKNLYLVHSELPGQPPGIGQTNLTSASWSILINATTRTATLYNGPNLSGSILSQKGLDPSQPWYVRFILSDATSSGFPEGDNSLFLYNYSSQRTSTLNNGLVASFSFSSNANDTSGHGHHGAVQGSVLTSDRFYVPNSAYAFSGTNDRIWIASHPDFEIAQNLTVAAWVRRAEFGRDVGDPILSKNFMPQQFGKSHFHFRFECSSCPGADRLAFWYWTDFWGWVGGTAGPAVRDTAWHHVAAVHEGSRIVFFLDGSQVGVVDVPVPMNPQNEPLQIGQGHGDAPVQSYFKGSIDEVRIYNRALSSTEIKALYDEARLSISVSQVSLCFETLPGKTYQLQYRTTLSPDAWVNLGSPIAGTGSPQCVTDEVPGPQRFYRIVPTGN